MQEGNVTVFRALPRQSARWMQPAAARTVMLVDDQPSEFKRSLAATLLVLRLSAGYSSQDLIAA